MSRRKELIDTLSALAAFFELSARSIEIGSSARTTSQRSPRRAARQTNFAFERSARTQIKASVVNPNASRPVRITWEKANQTPKSPEVSTAEELPPHSSTVGDFDKFKDVSPPSTVLPSEKTEQPSVPKSQDLDRWSAIKPHAAQELTFSAVPSTRLGRLFHYGGLAADVGLGVLSQTFNPNRSDDGNSPRYPLSEASVRRLVSRMSRMRGAALKIGQFASMQGSKVLPPQIEEILVRVQHSAHYMPEWQVQEVLASQLGSDWKDKFESFEMTPLAAASIGQVHRAVSLSGKQLAVKIQFPGVAKSVQSDIRNIALLLQAGTLLPRGLFLENSLAVLGRELADECNYQREAAFGQAFKALLGNDPAFAVPAVFENLSTEQVLTTEFATGRTLHNVDGLSQSLRDEIGSKILRLCLREIFHFQLMQTDPNWSNFLWQAERHEIELIDFGAGRRYADDFIEQYIALLRAAISGDRATCINLSRAIGYLTGEENEIMEGAHYQSMAALGEPFRQDSERPFSFRNQTITDRVRAQVPVMLRHRLTPPPQETYSLNRKLSGCFLLCARLGSRIDCVSMLDEVLASRDMEKREASHLLSSFGNRLD